MAWLVIFALNMCFLVVCVLHEVGIKLNWVSFQRVSCYAIYPASLDKTVQLSNVSSHYVRFIHPGRRIINSCWMKLSKVFGLSVASRLIICRGRKTRKIIYLQNTDKPRKFAITEFNNWFVTKFDFIFKPLCDSIGSNLTFFTRERGFNYARSRILFAAKHI